MADTYVVTGAARGLGLELVRELVERGDRVIGTVRREQDAARFPGGAESVVADVCDSHSLRSLAERLAGRAVDVLINNAGVGEGSFYKEREGPSVGQVDLAALEQTLRINTAGPLAVFQAVLPSLQRGRRKLVVNMSSELGSLEQNRGGRYVGYRISKAALNMLTRCIAGELRKDGFVCVSLHPGWVRTDMGGGEAPLDPPTSVAGMLRVIDALGPADNGAFIGYDGTRLPW